jgi:hypothetical protein
MKRRAQIVLPALYVAFAVYAWFDFVNTNHDGLANVGLFLVTLPVTTAVFFAGSLMGKESMPMPSGHGYLGDHALYYFPAVAVTAILSWLIGRLIDRWFARLR